MTITASLEEALTKLDLHDGDVVFVDGAAIDLVGLSKIPFGPRTPDVTFVAVRCHHGQSVKDALNTMSRDEASRCLEAIKEHKE